MYRHRCVGRYLPDMNKTFLKHSAEICRNRNKSWPVTQCYRMPINTQWNLLTAHITPTTLSSLLKHFPEENMPHSSNHFITHCLLTSVWLTKHSSHIYKHPYMLSRSVYTHAEDIYRAHVVRWILLSKWNLNKWRARPEVANRLVLVNYVTSVLRWKFLNFFYILYSFALEENWKNESLLAN